MSAMAIGCAQRRACDVVSEPGQTPAILICMSATWQRIGSRMITRSPLLWICLSLDAVGAVLAALLAAQVLDASGLVFGLVWLRKLFRVGVAA